MNHTLEPSDGLPGRALVPEGWAALDPAQLDAMARSAEQALLREGESPDTVRSYRSALRYWAAWFGGRYGRPIALPLGEAAVLQFIVDHAARTESADGRACELPPALDAALVAAGHKGRPGPLGLSTLLHRVSVLSTLHRQHALDNPCAGPRVRALLAGTRRAHARRGDGPAKKPALTREPLEAMLATCDDSLCGQRDRALLLFAFASGGRRRAEVVAATVENTPREGAHYIHVMGRSKTNPEGRARSDQLKPVTGRAAQALADWLGAAGITSGPLFRRVRRGDVIGEPLAAAAVRDIVRRRCALAGLPEDYSAHSLRSGFVTEAGRQGVPLGETMALTGHRSTASLIGYFRGAVTQSAAARLLEPEAEAATPAPAPAPQPGEP
ncbi:MAG: hypothetical protein RIQ53_2029 [Pseudomonadota bacterium]|jgi:integrase